MSERYVVVGNIVEEVNFFLLQEEASSDGVNRSITPAFVKESAILVKRLEVINVCR